MKITEIVWPLQAGGAITIPLSRNHALIAYKRARMKTAPGYEWLRIHERCHAAQIERWGVWGYWRRHIMARIRTGSMLAKNDPVESECYEAAKL